MQKEQSGVEYSEPLIAEEIIEISCEPAKAKSSKKSGFKGFSLGFGKKKQDKILPVLKEKEAYFKVTELYGMIKTPQSNGTLEAKTSVRNLMEKLKHETPFGQGNHMVITCENDIARYLEELEQNIEGLFDKELAKEASDVIVMNCSAIQAKLKIRTELKRK